MKYIGSKEENIQYRKRPGAYAIIVNKNDDKIGIVKVITDEGVENFYLGGGIEEGETKLEALIHICRRSWIYRSNSKCIYCRI